MALYYTSCVDIVLVEEVVQWRYTTSYIWGNLKMEVVQ